VKFADSDLIGIPHRFVIGDRSLAENKLEYKGRRDAQASEVALADVDAFVQKQIPRH
jgi:prolyl-tRNA synthetase